MSKNVLIVAHTSAWLDDFMKQIDAENVELSGGTSLDDVRRILDQRSIDIVIMGPPQEGDGRLQMIEHIYKVSKSTSVHLKAINADPLTFVNSILAALAI